MLFGLSFTLITNLSELALILGFITTHFVGVMMSGLISYSPTNEKSVEAIRLPLENFSSFRSVLIVIEGRLIQPCKAPIMRVLW